MRASGALSLALAALLAASSAPVAAAELSDAARRAYTDGVRAVEDEEYETAARKLREAVAQDPQEGLRRFRGTGVTFEDYFPHLYLGIALERLGRAAEAQKELEESQRQGFSNKRGGVYKRLLASLERARATVVAQVRPTPVPAVPTAPPRPAPPAPTATPAPPSPRATPARTAPTATPARPAATPTPAILRIPLPEPTDSRDALAELKSGIRAYFQGDFALAVRILDRRRAENPTARLFYAYALAGQCLLAGPARDEKLLARAREEFRQARAARAPVREDRLISKAVRTILEKG